ncbi:hypothetical protein BASA81_005769 [Batrachochytrium salamandrivorans]|nr:hypothetical protein BASA81_005769 [Batrachochytrium salamandrivorans]
MGRVLTSLQIFRSHIVRNAEDGTLDVSGLVSKACYQEWLDAKFALRSDAEAKKYHRALTNHVSGVDGRTPFEPEEEEAILILLRKREPWPCFPIHLATMGKRYRTMGYHEKQQTRGQSLLTTVLTPPEYHQRPIPMDELNGLLTGLDLSDRTYVQNLSKSIVLNFASPNFTLPEWKTVSQVFRYMILAKTNHCSLVINAEEQYITAERLCKQFTIDAHTLVMVLDLAAKSYAERCIIQNRYSLQVYNTLINNALAQGIDGGDLASVTMALGAAYLKPGKSYCVLNQKHQCANGIVKAFDMNYYVDPSSLLLVLWGKTSSPPPSPLLLLD